MNQLHVKRQIRIVPTLMAQLAIALVVSPGHADVGLRVESHPITAPIDAYVRVTEGGEPVSGLTPADFAVTLDGTPVGFTLTLPPNQDSTQKVSVVIVMNNFEFSPTRDYSPLIEQLAIGDFVSVVKYAADFDNLSFGGLWALPFTEIDGGSGSDLIQSFIEDKPPYYHSGGSFFFEGVMEGISRIEQTSATLPEGPKAIVSVECCGGRISLSEIVARANAASIPIFDVGNGAGALYPDFEAQMRSLATSTGGIHVRWPNAIANMGSWLRDGYRVTIPHTAIDDCKRHTLGVAVGAESRSVTFSRCDTTPEEFRFRDLTDADVSKHVRAKAVITGIETAVPVRVYGGQYSVGCTSAFTSELGRIRPGQSVCVRHTTAATGGLEVGTLLIVGGVPEWFVSTTAFPASVRPAASGTAAGAADFERGRDDRGSQ